MPAAPSLPSRRTAVRRAALTLASLLPLGALACTAKDAGSDTAAAAPGGAAGGKKTFRVAMIGKSSTNPVFLSGRTGAEAAAKELSQQHGVDVRIDWLTPPN